MKSVAQHHFPRYVFRDGKKLLWNPVLKNTFIDRPEEKVRLQILDYLILEAGFSTSRISFESPVNLPKDKSASRTDVICFDKNFKPLLLIECKAPEISLTEKASIQIARYNQIIEAPILLISNGLEDLWYETDSDSIINLKNIPDEFSPKSVIETDYRYWCERGFLGSKSNPEIQTWLLQSCETLFGSKNDSSASYFKFEGTSPDLFMANFYRIFSKNNSLKLALSLTSTPLGTTKLNGVLNIKGANKALFSCSLDLLYSGDSKNTVLQSASGLSQIDLSKEIGFDFKTSLTDHVLSMSQFLSAL